MIFVIKNSSYGKLFSDKIIVEIIINIVNNPFKKLGDKASGCLSINDLLKILISHNEFMEKFKENGKFI